MVFTKWGPPKCWWTDSHTASPIQWSGWLYKTRPKSADSQRTSLIAAIFFSHMTSLNYILLCIKAVDDISNTFELKLYNEDRGASHLPWAWWAECPEWLGGHTEYPAWRRRPERWAGLASWRPTHAPGTNTYIRVYRLYFTYWHIHTEGVTLV